MTFYIGMKMKRNDETISPGPAAYNLRKIDTLNESKRSFKLNIKAPRIKTEYF